VLQRRKGLEQDRDLIDSLRKKQSEIIDAFKRDKQAVNTQSDDGIQDLADKAASAYSKELNFSLTDGERNLLVLIDESFNRLDAGTYGTWANAILLNRKAKTVVSAMHF